MWMTRKSMIMTTKTKVRLRVRARTDRSQELPNMRKMAMVIKVSSMATTSMAMIIMNEGVKMTRRICGDCNVAGMACTFLFFHAYMMEYWALFTSGRVEVPGRVFFGKCNHSLEA